MTHDERVKIAIVIEITQDNFASLRRAKALSTVHESPASVIEPDLVIPHIGNERVKIAIAIQVPQRYAKTGRISKRLNKRENASTFVFPNCVCIALLGGIRNKRINIAIAINITQRHSFTRRIT